MNAVIELEQTYDHYKNDPGFNQELEDLFHNYAGRPSFENGKALSRLLFAAILLWRSPNSLSMPWSRQVHLIELGMDGLILPDIPFEEKEEFDGICQKYGLVLISMIAPTSYERIRMIAKETRGFLYCVSSLGVTGTRSEITTDIGAMIRLVKEETDIPCSVGFGISTPEQVAKWQRYRME